MAFYDLGLTTTTQLSFSSSNSSFSKCVRNHHYHSTPIIQQIIVSVVRSLRTLETVTTHHDSHHGKEHTFTDTFFKFKNDNGCSTAIYQTQGRNTVIQRCLYLSIFTLLYRMLKFTFWLVFMLREC